MDRRRSKRSFWPRRVRWPATPTPPRALLPCVPACAPGLRPPRPAIRRGCAAHWSSSIGNWRFDRSRAFRRDHILVTASSRLARPQVVQRGGDMLAKNASKVGPRYPQVVVLVGATGDLSRRKLLPGLFHLVQRRLHPRLPDHRRLAGRARRRRLPQDRPRGARSVLHAARSNEADWAAFAATLDYVPMSAGAGALKDAVEAAERSLGRREPSRALSERAARRRPVGGAAAGRSRSRRATAASSWKSPSAPTSPAPCR